MEEKDKPIRSFHIEDERNLSSFIEEKEKRKSFF